MKSRLQTLRCDWDGELTHAIERSFDGANGFLLGEDGAHLAAFRSEVYDGGRVALIDARTAEHDVRIEIDEATIHAFVGRERALQISRASGEVWDRSDRVGYYARFCCRDAWTTIPSIPTDERGIAMASLVWNEREIAGLAIGPGKPYGAGAQAVCGPRLLRSAIESDREALAVFVVALLETAFFGVIRPDRIDHAPALGVARSLFRQLVAMIADLQTS